MSAVTQNEFTGNNSTTTYPFTFPYLKTSDIKASLDGVETTAFTLPNATTLQFNTAPPQDAKIRIFRETGIDDLTATFYAGSAIKSEDLNDNFTQNLYVTQEVNQRFVNTLGGSMVGNLTMDQNAKIIFEGSTADDHETTITVADPTADRTITFPNVTGTVVTTGDTGTVATGMIANDAVTMDKLDSGALPTDITVASANIVDGTIVNADVNAAAAIDGTKINPNFGSQNIATTGTAATGAHTVTGNIVVSGTVDGRDVAADGTKLDGIESGATADQTAAEIRTLVGNATDSNVFTDADHTKLDAIEAGATADQTASEIRTLVEAANDSNVFTDADHTKLNNIETAATADQTDAEIRAAVEAATDSNVFTDADHTKLNGIETGATADQTNAEIKTAYEANADTNEFSDAEQTKLANIETAATADQTAAEIKTLLQSDKLTISEMNTTSLDTRYFTETEADARYFRQDTSETIASGDTWSNTDAKVATTAAINARIVDLIDDVGGFTAITSEQHFPNTNPQGTTGQAAILSIQAASTTLTPSGTTVTVSNGNLANNANITITGVSAAIPSGFGFLVESTSTLHTYTFHRLIPKATEVTTVAANAVNISAAGANVADINNFADLYQIGNSAPTARADTSSLQEGDLWYDSSNDNIRVYTGSAYAAVTPTQQVLDDIAIVSGSITYAEDLGLITDAVTTGSSNGSLEIVADALEDEITFAVTVASGAFLIDGVSKPTLTLHKGWTYTFDVSDNTNASHPLRFSSGGSAYNTGVTVTGTQGQAGAKVQLVVPESQPASFIYYCTNHSGMGNSITVVEDPIKAVADIASNVTTVAGISSNVTSVAGNSSNINAAVSNASNINSAVSNASNINSAVSNASNINSAVSNASNINTVAGSISDVNRYANEYQISSSQPGSPSAGDLWFDTANNTLKNYNGTAWLGITSNSGIQNVVDDTTPELGGNLDALNRNMLNVGTISGNNLQLDFGTI